MNIGMGIWAFVVYLVIIIGWNTLTKRSITEAMLIGLVIVSLFNGVTNIPATLAATIYKTVTAEIFLATMLFVFMSSIMTRTGIIEQLVGILNSIIGRLKGGSAYVAVLASGMFGLVSGSSVANAATVGTISIPWMVESGWPKEVAATINTGNAGSGQSFPASSAMFLLLGFPQIAATVTIDNFYITMLTAGLWCIIYRMLIVRYYVTKYKIKAFPSDQIQPFRKVIRTNWTSLLMFAGIIIPLFITIGPLSGILKKNETFGPDGLKSISIIMWVPVIMSIICIIYGWRRLPRTFKGWSELILTTKSSFNNVGGVILFAMAGSEVLSLLGFGDDLNILLQSMNLPKVVMVFIVGIMVALVAGPLSGVATAVALGAVSFAALTSVGVTPAAAVAAFLIWMSTEGASPPSSAPIFISCSLAEVDRIQSTFIPLIFHYVIPIVCVGAFIALGILPLVNG